MLHHLVRRGAEMTTDMMRENHAQAWENLNYEMPKWGVAVIFGTAMTFILLIASVSSDYRSSA